MYSSFGLVFQGYGHCLKRQKPCTLMRISIRRIAMCHSRRHFEAIILYFIFRFISKWMGSSERISNSNPQKGRSIIMRY